MLKLLEKINQDLVRAMKSKDAETTSVLRMLNAAIINKEITVRQGGKAELKDEQVLEVIASEIKKRKEAIEAYELGGRQDLADKEKREIGILEKYLPAQLSDQDLEKIIKEIIDSGITDFGRLMGQVMGKVKGRAEGGRVGQMVKKMLVR